MASLSYLTPRFVRRLAAAEVKTVMICGCGGGFDFVHGMALYPELKRMGKRVVVASYSFGSPGLITGEAPVVFQDESSPSAMAKLVSAKSVPQGLYGPEVHLCSYLDSKYPNDAPHTCYAFYARAFCVPSLTRLYSQIVKEHLVDAIIAMDGGSDSLMKGDEEGLGDPIEDAVSLATIAGLSDPRIVFKSLITVGLGCDRYNSVSDSSSLRAIAELTRAGGFLGSMSLEPTSEAFLFYKGLVDHIYSRQQFRSVVTGCVVAAAEGNYGDSNIPEALKERGIRQGEMFFWPLMAVLWGFDLPVVAKRSLICGAIATAKDSIECGRNLHKLRSKVKVREYEDLPFHTEFAHDGGKGSHFAP